MYRKLYGLSLLKCFGDLPRKINAYKYSTVKRNSSLLYRKQLLSISPRIHCAIQNSSLPTKLFFNVPVLHFGAHIYCLFIENAVNIRQYNTFLSKDNVKISWPVL